MARDDLTGTRPFRGGYLEHCSRVESELDQIILAFFDLEESTVVEEVFFASYVQHSSFRRRREVTRRILKATDLSSEFPDLMAELKLVSERRNLLAHDFTLTPSVSVTVTPGPTPPRYEVSEDPLYVQTRRDGAKVDVPIPVEESWDLLNKLHEDLARLLDRVSEVRAESAKPS